MSEFDKIYKVLDGSDLEALELEVRDFLEDGFELAGGVCFDPFHNRYLQAVRKKVIRTFVVTETEES